MTDDHFSAFEEKMKQAGTPAMIIENFRWQYGRLVGGERGYLPESKIKPVRDLPDSEEFDGSYLKTGEKEKDKAVVIKLNGGLGTSMGMDKAKSLLTVKDGLTFLDIIIRQTMSHQIPLLLMNTIYTHAAALAVIRKYPQLKQKIPFDFIQSLVPKVRKDNLEPVSLPGRPELEWSPPGHGGLYLSLCVSGLLDSLIGSGYRYAFISNSDNLAASLDFSIFGYFVQGGFDLMVEAADRTENDRKGGHLAKTDRGLVLREVAQCPEEDLDEFQNIQKHRYFNTNNIWLNLESLRVMLRRTKGRLPLPLIRNEKPVDPQDPDSIRVYQLETAMGTALSFFDRTEAIRVPKSRFAPVKTTNELLEVRSDAYVLTDDYNLVLSPKRINPKPPIIALDQKYFKMISDFETRVKVTPSLVNCDSLTIEGDYFFDKKKTCTGDVRVG